MPRNGSRKRRATNAAAKGAKDVDRGVGHRIRARRMERRMTQSALGALLGVSFQQIQKYEKGVNRIGTSRLVEIARALEIDVATLVGDKEGEYQITPIGRFMATKDGIDIAEAMMAITDAGKRRAVIVMARSIADEKK